MLELLQAIEGASAPRPPTPPSEDVPSEGAEPVAAGEADEAPGAVSVMQLELRQGQGAALELSPSLGDVQVVAFIPPAE